MTRTIGHSGYGACFRRASGLKPSLLVLVGIAAVAFIPQNALGQVPFTKHGSLVTVVPGIRDEASDVWLGNAASISPTSQQWVVREEGVDPYNALKQVPADHIITIPTGASAAYVRDKLSAISKDKDVTVIVDMKLKLHISEAGWGPHTKWASTVSETLAKSHAKNFPNARNLYMGHSAGTEPVAMMSPEMTDLRKGAKEKTRRLYDDIMVLSGRRGTDDPGYPKWAVLAFADGDLYANPKGTIDSKSVIRSYGERDAIAYAQKGYSVVRIVEKSTAWSNVTDLVSFGIGGIASTAKNRIEQHSRAAQVAIDRDMVYYEANTAKAIPMPTAPLGTALKLAVEVQARPGTSPEQAIETLKAKQPTKGIGGISLNSSAYLPVDPTDVDRATYDGKTGSITLILTNGKKLALPPLGAEATRQSYDIVYREGLKAELSISRNRATAPDGQEVSNVQGAGKSSVYYFGNTKDTLLGLSMFRADHMLGELAFSMSADVKAVAKRVPGFHSLVEMFPEKYASNPAQDEYSGWGGRIFLTPRTVVMHKSADGQRLQFEQFQVSIHFGQNGPAESAFAGFFVSHFQEIMKTEPGAAFAGLIPYARGAAVFRWMRENHVRFEPGTLEEVEVGQVFTPTSIEHRPGTKLEDVEVQCPTVFFSLVGPTRFVRKDAKESTVSYVDGKVSEVRRYDGQILRVYRDGVGMPVAVQWQGHGVAFQVDPKSGLVMARNVELQTGEYGVTVSKKTNTTHAPIVNPESIITSFVLRFINGEVNL